MSSDMSSDMNNRLEVPEVVPEVVIDNVGSISCEGLPYRKFSREEHDRLNKMLAGTGEKIWIDNRVRFIEQKLTGGKNSIEEVVNLVMIPEYKKLLANVDPSPTDAMFCSERTGVTPHEFHCYYLAALQWHPYIKGQLKEFEDLAIISNTKAIEDNSSGSGNGNGGIYYEGVKIYTKGNTILVAPEDKDVVVAFQKNTYIATFDLGNNSVKWLASVDNKTRSLVTNLLRNTRNADDNQVVFGEENKIDAPTGEEW